MPISVIVADDHPIVLEGLRQLFNTAGSEFKLLALCMDAEQALENIRKLRPQVAVVDIRMPQIDGIELLRRIRSEHLMTRVVLLTAHITDEELVEAVRLRVGGVVLKEAAPRQLLQCIRAVSAGQQWLDDSSMRRALDKMLRREAGITEVSRTLTPREIEIVGMIGRGMRNRQIAEKLSITEGTVKIHLHSVYQKLGVSGRLELSIYAREKGLV